MAQTRTCRVLRINDVRPSPQGLRVVVGLDVVHIPNSTPGVDRLATGDMVAFVPGNTRVSAKSARYLLPQIESRITKVAALIPMVRKDHAAPWMLPHDRSVMTVGMTVDVGDNVASCIGASQA